MFVTFIFLFRSLCDQERLNKSLDERGNACDSGITPFYSLLDYCYLILFNNLYLEMLSCSYKKRTRRFFDYFALFCTTVHMDTFFYWPKYVLSWIFFLCLQAIIKRMVRA